VAGGQHAAPGRAFGAAPGPGGRACIGPLATCAPGQTGQVGRGEVATTLREVLAFPSIRVIDADLLNRVVEVDEATASTSLKPISSQAPSERAWASSPHSIDRTTVRREEPAERRSMMAGEPGAVGYTESGQVALGDSWRVAQRSEVVPIEQAHRADAASSTHPIARERRSCAPRWAGQA